MSEDISNQEAQSEQKQEPQVQAQEPQQKPKGETFRAVLSKIRPETQPKPDEKPQESPPEHSKQPAAATEQKAEEKPPEVKEQQQEQKQQEEQHKKTARDRIQQLAREKNEWKEKAEKAEAQIAELERLRKIPDDRMSARDIAREAYLQEQVVAQQDEMRSRLINYMQNHENPKQFEANYNYYTPLFLQHDPETIKAFSEYPNVVEMLDCFYQAFTSGAATPEQWVNLPYPDKVRRIGILSKSLSQAKEQAANPQPAQQQQPAKQVPDSIKPVISNSPNTPHDPNNEANKGSTFKRIMGDRR